MLDLGDIRIHDLRRTGASQLTGLGIPVFHVSKVLNHTSDKGGAASVTSTYDVHEYAEQKRQALDAWSVPLLEIVSGESKPDNVVVLNKAKS